MEYDSVLHPDTYKVTIVIHARRFELSEHLKEFIQECLHMLPPEGKITTVMLQLEEKNIPANHSKYCVLNAKIAGDHYFAIKHAGSYEQAAVMSISSLNQHIRKIMETS